MTIAGYVGEIPLPRPPASPHHRCQGHAGACKIAKPSEGGDPQGYILCLMQMGTTTELFLNTAYNKPKWSSLSFDN